MSKIDDNLRPATLEDRRPLADSELDAVTGGQDSHQFRGRYQLRMDEARSDLTK